MPQEYVTNLTSTEKARKYQYVIDGLTKTWVDSNFMLMNLKRAAGARYSPGGRQAIIPLETATSGSFRFSAPGEPPAEAGTATYDEATIDFTTFSTSIEYDWHAKLASQSNKLAFIQIRTKQVADAAEVLGYRWSHAIFAPKHNAMARLKTDLGGNQWQLYREDEAGANGTFGARYLFKTGYASASANLVGTEAERGFDGFTLSFDRVDDTVQFSGLNMGTLTADDYIFWGSKARTSKGRGLTGLPQIVNDGVDFAVFEGRDRTVAGNEDWQAGVIRGFGSGNIERRMMNSMIELDKRIGMKTDVILYGLKTQLMHFQQMATQRRSMMPVSGMTGGPTFTGGFNALPIDYGDRKIAAMANRENPDSLMYGLNWDCIALAMLAEPTWIDEGEGQMKHIPDSFSWKGHLAGVGQICSKLPSAHWVVQDITP